ncbi:MAG TPA: acyl-CoA dehydrogenase family protein [Candidatus Solibacter sp.]|jgi:acyl-CoA dehydrogenase|nr:acyl-CoA dehydrogenase family protein [Candidatus Solibacter sp.]
MVSFELSAEQLEMKQWIHDFAEKRIRPAAAEWDEREETPWPLIQEAADIGLYSVDFLQQSFAGDDASGLLGPIAQEELFWGDAGIGLSIMGSSLAAAGIFASGTPDQVVQWLPECYGTAKDIKLGAFAVTEPNAGSDVRSLKTIAKRDGSDWVLNGTKVFITNGGIADTHVVVAAVEPELGAKGQATFVVPKGTKGISQGAKHKKMGIRASHTAEVILDDCRIPGEYLLGGEEKLESRLAKAKEGHVSKGSGALRTFEMTRPLVGAQAVGIARAAYEFALDYAHERTAFGRAIIENQAIAFKLADMITEIEASRLLVWHAAWMARNGQEFDKGQGSMSKLKAGEMAVWVTEQAIQILGGYGYVREYPVERWHRDSKIYTIFEGTSEIQRLVISRAISGARAM